MKKLLFFLAALFVSLGIQAQTNDADAVAQRGAEKGYYPFPAEVTGMRKLTGTDALTHGMNIMIQHNHEGTQHADHDGWYLTIYSLSEPDQTYHGVFMNEKPTGVGIFELEHPEDAPEGMFLLQTAHMQATGENCYLGVPYSTFNTSQNYPGSYEFRWVEGKGWIVATGNRALQVTLDSKDVPQIGYIDTQYNNNYTYFNIYEVQETHGTIKYVEDADVTLVGPAGNEIVTKHTGWSDFYEFVKYSGSTTNAINYGVSLLNAEYHEETNQITAYIQYPFPVSGNNAKVPVHLCPTANKDVRISIVDGQLKVVEKPDGGWVKDSINQWYIYPKFEDNNFTYAIQNVKTQEYINFVAPNREVTLGDAPCYFTLAGNSTGDNFYFQMYKNGTSNYYLFGDVKDYYSWGKLQCSAYTVYSTAESVDGRKFLVPRVSGEELDGVDAIGFTRYYHEDTYFWDAGEVNVNNAPKGVKALFSSSDHEDFNVVGADHRLYSAETGITVTKVGDVTATFEYISGKNGLLILGVDVVNNIGQAIAFDYHTGMAAKDPYAENNVYTLNDVPMGEYTLRYWVCSRVDKDANEGHNLKNTRGKITVTGANYRIMFSQPLVNGQFAANTTWFRMRLHDDLQRYISAQPAYMDDNNYLKLTNNTPPNDNAGLWAVIGDAENGYKFYNRAWGPKYALTTTGYETGNGGDARTYMVPADSASVYDIVNVPGSYTFSVKLRVDDTDNAYFNYRSGYLGIWNSSAALGEANSIMTFETVHMDGWDEASEALMNDIKKRWRPWIAEPEIGNAYYTLIENADFAFMMQNRLSIFIGLDGKVFKFANIDTASSNRTGKILAVHSDSKVAGIAATETIQDYLQLFHNGDGTFKLYHPQSGRYLKTPDNAETTADAAEAANFTYDMYEDEEGIVAFRTGNQMVHLKNNGNPLSIMNHNDLKDAASRWRVSYSQEAQDLVGVIATARARYAEVMADTYQANLGVPGYATAATVAALNDSITASLATTDLEAAKKNLEAAMQAILDEEKAPHFPTDCYFTFTNKNGRGSVVYDDAAEKAVDTANGDAAYLWHNTSVDAANANHIWGFLYNPIKEEYYLYNVGAQQFASPTGLGAEGHRYGSQGDTWIFSDVPVAISLTDLGEKYFHIQGGSKTMSISTSYYGSVITYYAAGDPGVPFRFEKSAYAFDEALLKTLEAKVRAAGLYNVTDLSKLSNVTVYGLSTSRGPLAYVSGIENTLSSPKRGSAADVPANPTENENEQFAILRTENTPNGKYYLYNITKQRFINAGAAFTENPVAVTSFSATSSSTYPWFVWLGGNERININQGNGLIMKTSAGAGEDAGNQFRIVYVAEDTTKTAAAIAAIEAYEAALLEAAAEAQEFLNNTPQVVGYPKDAKRAEFQTAIDARESLAAITAAKTAFMETADVNMPESGKAYVFTNVHPAGGKKYLNYAEDGLTMVARGDGAANNLPESAKWYCRKLDDGRYTFVNTAGKYLVFKGSGNGTNSNKGYVDAYDATYSPITFVKMTTSGYTGSTKLEDLFGYVAFGGRRIYNGTSAYFVTEADGDFQQDTGWTLRYDDDYSTAFIVEEVTNYPLANTKLTAIDSDDTLLKGMTPGQTIGTFSAPYATVIPEGVKAYYAKEAEKEGSLYLKPVESGVLPAQEGVILVGELGEGGQAVTLASMLPVAGEQGVEISNNEFANSAMGDVVIGNYDYILANGTEGIGIYKAKAGTKLKQGKAYLSFVSATAARSFVMNFGSVATDVETTLTESALENTIYDLSGRRVNEVTKGGIYIVNGKKVFIK